jgi:hypothetical protein
MIGKKEVEFLTGKKEVEFLNAPQIWIHMDSYLDFWLIYVQLNYRVLCQV